MKIALAQLNTIVGDCEGNLAGVLSALEKARGAEARRSSRRRDQLLLKGGVQK